MKTKVLIVTVEFFIVNCFSMKSERPSRRRACPNKRRAKKKQLFSIELGLQSHKIAEFSCNFSLLKDVFFSTNRNISCYIIMCWFHQKLLEAKRAKVNDASQFMVFTANLFLFLWKTSKKQRLGSWSFCIELPYWGKQYLLRMFSITAWFPVTHSFRI